MEAEWDCEGTEASLLDCPMVPRDCDHNRDAGVYCFGKTNQYTVTKYACVVDLSSLMYREKS